jgi:excisionase family DNA binding protein
VIDSRPLQLSVPPAFVESIVREVVAIVLQELSSTQAAPPSPYMTILEAAEYLRCSRQRVYDLRSSGQLTRLGDGRRALVSRAELDEIAAGGVAHPLPTHRRSRMKRGRAA